MALSCAELRGLLDEDASLADAPAREHLASCADCRRAVERWRAVEAQLREYSEQAPPPFLHRRLMAHIRAAGPAPQPLLMRRWQAPVLATALLVAVVGLWQAPLHAPGPPARPTEPAAAPAVAPPALSAPTPPGPTQTAPPSAPAAPPAAEILRGPAAVEAAVTCALTGPDGSPARRTLALEPRWAPAAGVTWSVLVATNGTVRPDVGAGEAAPLEALEAIAALDLAPGRYTLQRAR